MREVTNRFGTGDIYNIHELIRPRSMRGRTVEIISTACMSVTSDMQSWIEYMNAQGCLAESVEDAHIIIILGCQVTDLAILNDIKTAEEMQRRNPGADIYMGGCLAQRFDIDLPSFIRRLDVARHEYQQLGPYRNHSVHWQKPFWISEKEWNSSSESGKLFRDM